MLPPRLLGNDLVPRHWLMRQFLRNNVAIHPVPAGRIADVPVLESVAGAGHREFTHLPHPCVTATIVPWRR